MPHLVRDHRLELISTAQREQSVGYRDMRMFRVEPGRERVRVRVADEPDPRPRHTSRDGHLFHHVHEAGLLIAGRRLDLASAGGPENAVRAGLPRENGENHREAREDDAHPRKRVAVGVRRRPARQLVENPVATEPEPGEERDENDDEPPRPAPVGVLLLEEIGGVGHGESRQPSADSRSRQFATRRTQQLLTHGGCRLMADG